MFEHSFFLGLSNTLRSMAGLPVWLRETKEQSGAYLGLLTLASKEFKEINAGNPFPITTSAMTNSFIQTRKLILGQNDYAILIP